MHAFYLFLVELVDGYLKAESHCFVLKVRGRKIKTKTKTLNIKDVTVFN